MEDALSTKVTEYDDALRWIFNRINYERISPQRSSEHFRLERVEQLLRCIGAPQERIPVVHIAGTKGKGSTAAVLSSIVSAAGIRCGLYTSPHIHRFEERMVVDGVEPDQQEMVALVGELKERLTGAPDGLGEDAVTYFEVATLLAWMYFDRSNVELVVLETGLGGRLDTTNICRPLLTVITAIGLDHTNILGDTISQIAAEKAGIIKSGVPVLTSATQPDALDVIAKTASDHASELWRLPGEIRVNTTSPDGAVEQLLDIATPERSHTRLHLHLAGEHQAQNAALAVAAADALYQKDRRFTSDAVADGVAAARWPLRFEIIPGQPDVVIDVAHNPDAVEALASTFRRVFDRERRAVLLFASSTDKDASEMLRILCPWFDAFVFTEFCRNPRATDCASLAETAAACLANRAGDREAQVIVNKIPQDALNEATALAGQDGVVCVTGSFFLAAEIRELLPN